MTRVLRILAVTVMVCITSSMSSSMAFSQSQEAEEVHVLSEQGLEREEFKPWPDPVAPQLPPPPDEDKDIDLSSPPNPCPSCCSCHAPCVRKYSTTVLPSNGEYGVYNIKIREDQCSCKILHKDHKIYPIKKFGGYTNAVHIIRSPDFRTTTNYSELIFADYRINCPGAGMIFFKFFKLDLEGRNCNGNCVDAVQLHGGQFGSQIFCGNQKPTEATLHSGSHLRVTFRSNGAVTSKGFAASAVCLRANGPSQLCRRRKSAESFEAFQPSLSELEASLSELQLERESLGELERELEVVIRRRQDMHNSYC